MIFVEMTQIRHNLKISFHSYLKKVFESCTPLWRYSLPFLILSTHLYFISPAFYILGIIDGRALQATQIKHQDGPKTSRLTFSSNLKSSASIFRNEQSLNQNSTEQNENPS